MPIYSKNIGFASVASRGVSKLADRSNRREEIQANNAENKLRKNRANLQNDPESLKKEFEVLNANYDAIINKQAKDDTVDQFRLYIKTGNPNHLTNLFKNNKKVRNQFRGILSIEKLDPENDLKLLTEKGIKLENYRPETHLKAIMPDGSAQLFDVMGVGTGTGAFNVLMGEELDLMSKWLKANGKDGKGGTGVAGQLEKDSTFAANTLPEHNLESATRMFTRKKVAGLEPGQQEEADKVLNEMIGKFDGEEGFYNTDFTESSNKRLIARDITKYKAFSGVDFSSRQEADIEEINNLVKMAEGFVDNVKPTTVGFFDNLFRTTKNVLSDAVDEDIIKENKARSSFAAFRNLTLRSLSGLTLTDGEIKNFKEEMGSLNQQFPAVMVNFQTQLKQLQSRLQSIGDLNDPILAHYYMRATPIKIGKMLNSIDVVLEQFSQDQGNRPGEVPTNANTNDNNTIIGNQDDFNKLFEDLWGPSSERVPQ